MKFNKSFSIILVLIFTVTIFPALVEAQKTDGSIDWDTGIITVMGHGAPPEDATEGQAKLMARRAAKADAYRNAVEFIEGVRVDSETIVKDFITQSDKIKLEVQGFIQNGKFTKIEYNEENICKVQLKLPLGGQKGLSSFFEKGVKEKSAEEEIENIDQYLDKSKEKTKEKKESIDDESNYTGIIIDTRDYNVDPAIYPQIFDTEGKRLYGPAIVDENPEKVPTLVAYSREKNEAMKMERLGNNPLMIEATSVIKKEDSPATDVIINSKNAEIFRELNKSNNIVNRRAVVFIIE